MKQNTLQFVLFPRLQQTTYELSMENLKYKYKYAEDYNPKYVHGVFGGVGPRGEIIMHFFMERMAVPKVQVYEVEGNQLKGEIVEERIPKDLELSAIRFVQTGVVLDLKTAEALREWLDGHIKARKEMG